MLCLCGLDWGKGAEIEMAFYWPTLMFKKRQKKKTCIGKGEAFLEQLSFHSLLWNRNPPL